MYLSLKTGQFFIRQKTTTLSKEEQMKKSIHSESEIVKAVKELESGVSAEVVARNHGVTRVTLYNWKSKYSGMDVSLVKRLKELEEKIQKLKQMYADLGIGQSDIDGCD